MARRWGARSYSHGQPSTSSSWHSRSEGSGWHGWVDYDRPSWKRWSAAAWQAYYDEWPPLGTTKYRGRQGANAANASPATVEDTGTIEKNKEIDRLDALVASMQAAVIMGDEVATRSASEWGSKLASLRKERRLAKPLPAQVGSARNKIRDCQLGVDKNVAALCEAKEALAEQQKKVALMEERVETWRVKLKAAETALAELDENCAAPAPPTSEGGVMECCRALLTAMEASQQGDQPDAALVAGLRGLIKEGARPAHIIIEEPALSSVAPPAHVRDRSNSRSPRGPGG